MRTEFNRRNKLQGEEAELAFMLKAVRQEFRVARPHGDSAPYDFILEWQSRLHRIQFKSTRCFDLKRGYQVLSVWGFHRSCHYTEEHIDFFVVWIEPEDHWYILPVAATKHRYMLAFPIGLPGRKNRWSQYLEAWHLLKHAAQDA